MRFLSFFVGMVLLCGSAGAEIVEIRYMHELFSHIEEGALVLFDIDNTLMQPVQELGSSQWFEHRVREFENGGMTRDKALETVLPEWVAIQSLTQVKPVEPETKKMIRHLQEDGYTVMGLCTRGPGLSTRTGNQLATLNIDLAVTAPISDEVFFTNVNGILFRKGILFTAGTHKGESLAQFLEIIGHEPESIIYVNDRRSRLEEVEQMCTEQGIPFKGLRYGFLDEKVRNFRKQVAEVQLYFFGRLLSDDAAERVLKGV